MARFCTRCGTKNADDAKFCESCGAPLRAPVAASTAASASVQHAPQPTPQPIPQPVRAGLSRRAGVLILSGMALLLLVVAVVAWRVLGPSTGPSSAELRAAANTWLQQHQAGLLQQDACVRNFNYSANPVFVNGFDTQTQTWLNALVKAGIYSGPQTVQSGFITQLKYSYGPQAARYIRSGALCVADGLSVKDVQVLQPGSAAWAERLPVTVKLPQDWALIRLKLQWIGLAPWAQQEPVSYQFTRLAAPLQQDLLLHKTQQGWVLPSPSEELGMQAQLGLLAAGGAVGQAAQQFGQQLGNAMQAFGGQSNATAAQPPSSPGFWDWLKNLFGFADPARRLPGQFYGDVQSGRFDAAYALLGPQMQILGPEKMKMAMQLAQSEIQSKGGLRDVNILEVTDQAGAKRVRYAVQFGNGSQQTETMLIGKIGDQWRILSIDGR